MKVFFAADHAAYEQKNVLAEVVRDLGHEAVDLGTNGRESVHYPDYAEKLCKEVLNNENSLGILVCGSGIGMSIMANKFLGIRAAQCKDILDARLSRSHNGANVLCLGARTTGPLLLEEMVKVWLITEPEKGRHLQRQEMMNKRGEKLV